jgi:superfamily II DNA/RNA helicase
VPSTFADLGVPTHLNQRLARRGITEPFPIQSLTLPDAFAGRDICGRAPTGSGKTLAFGLPITARIDRAEPRRPRALVLVPTRELAAQVAGEIEALASGSHRVVAVYGGASYGPQRRALAKGVATVVACPGRLEDLIDQGDIELREVEVVVLDEADRMADMGFLPAVRRILDMTRSERQTMLFSATLDRDVDTIVRRYLRDPARHEVATGDDSDSDVEHLFWRAERAERVSLVSKLVQRHERALVFCRTRRGADRLAKQLVAAGVGAKAIHGNRTQAQRERALAAFGRGRVSALVATDVAARGIHVDDVGCVIHFDLPEDPKDYVHRSGRTGRAGASGTVVSLVPQEQRRAVRALQRALGLRVELADPDVAGTRSAPAMPRGSSEPRPGKSESDERSRQRRRKRRSTPGGKGHGHGGGTRRGGPPRGAKRPRRRSSHSKASGGGQAQTKLRSP